MIKPITINHLQRFDKTGSIECYQTMIVATNLFKEIKEKMLEDLNNAIFKTNENNNDILNVVVKFDLFKNNYVPKTIKLFTDDKIDSDVFVKVINKEIKQLYPFASITTALDEVGRFCIDANEINPTDLKDMQQEIKNGEIEVLRLGLVIIMDLNQNVINVGGCN